MKGTRFSSSSDILFSIKVGCNVAGSGAVSVYEAVISDDCSEDLDISLPMLDFTLSFTECPSNSYSCALVIFSNELSAVFKHSLNGQHWPLH